MIKKLLVIMLCMPVHAAPVLVESGSLKTLLQTIPIAGSGTNVFRLPTGPELTAFRVALQNILDGNLEAAAGAAEMANYEVVSYTDIPSADVFALLREKSSKQHWGGIYAIDLTPERALVVECPHPLYDGVRQPASDLFMETHAVAYLQAGAHRNNSLTESPCDYGDGDPPYRISDMAHSPETFFQAAHEVLETHFPRTVSLSYHGMGETADPSDITISNGTSHDFAGYSLSRALASRMNEILTAANDTRFAVSHQEPGQGAALSGSTNTQGRVTNGSSDPCSTPPPNARYPERFIHMETDGDVRNAPASNWAFVNQTFTELIPLFSDPVTDLPAGKLVITEIMADPAQVGDATGEYIELFNHTGAPIEMIDWIIADRGGNTATFSGTIQPGDLFVVGVSADLNGAQPGGQPDAVWSDTSGDLTFTNTGDIISVLDANRNLAASVAYTSSAVIPGKSLEISMANAHAHGQTSDLDCAISTTAFGNDFGSPGTRGGSGFPPPPVSLTPALAGSDLHLAFPSARAVNYVLWSSPDLMDWNVVPAVEPVTGDGTPKDFTLELPMDRRHFYRLAHDYAAPR